MVSDNSTSRVVNLRLYLTKSCARQLPENHDASTGSKSMLCVTQIQEPIDGKEQRHARRRTEVRHHAAVMSARRQHKPQPGGLRCGKQPAMHDVYGDIARLLNVLWAAARHNADRRFRPLKLLKRPHVRTQPISTGAAAAKQPAAKQTPMLRSTSPQHVWSCSGCGPHVQ